MMLKTLQMNVARPCHGKLSIRPAPVLRHAHVVPRQVKAAAATSSAPWQVVDQEAPIGDVRMDWVHNKLNELLVGLEHSTRRVKVRCSDVQRVSRAEADISKYTQKRRCNGLDLDIKWEMWPTGAEATTKPVEGVAKVLFSTRGHHDRVEVSDIRLLGNATGQPGTRFEDIQLAVQAMEPAIMQALNSLLWEVEQGAAPLNSFMESMEEEEEEEQLREGGQGSKDDKPDLTAFPPAAP